MAPRANWEKLMLSFDFKKWEEIGKRKAMAQKYLPKSVSYFCESPRVYAPIDVIEELIGIPKQSQNALTAAKFHALQNHLKISDSANSLRLAQELLTMSTDDETPEMLVAQFVRDLLAK